MIPLQPSRLSRGLGLAVLLLAVAMLLNGCTGSSSVEELYSRATHRALACDFEDALSLSEKCLERAPDHVQARILQGYCRYRLMTPEQMQRESSTVIDVMRQAVELAPGDFISQYYLGWMLFEAGLCSHALKPLEEAHRLRGQCPEHDADVLAMLSMCCVSNNLRGGREYLLDLQTIPGFARSPLVYNALGVLSVKQCDYQSALGWFMQALRRDPNNAVVLQNLAVLFDERLQRADEAMRYYARAIAARQAMRDSSRQDEMRRRLRQLSAARRQPATRRQ